VTKKLLSSLSKSQSESFSLTQYPTGENSNAWYYPERTRAEDGSEAYQQTVNEVACTDAAASYIASAYPTWPIPTGAVITSVTVQIKFRTAWTDRKLTVAASWNTGTNYTTWQTYDLPPTTGWISYDALQGHPVWTKAELDLLRTRFCGPFNSVTYPLYVDVVKVVVTYEV